MLPFLLDFTHRYCLLFVSGFSLQSFDDVGLSRTLSLLNIMLQKVPEVCIRDTLPKDLVTCIKLNSFMLK